MGGMVVGRGGKAVSQDFCCWQGSWQQVKGEGKEYQGGQ